MFILVIRCDVSVSYPSTAGGEPSEGAGEQSDDAGEKDANFATDSTAPSRNYYLLFYFLIYSIVVFLLFFIFTFSL